MAPGLPLRQACAGGACAGVGAVVGAGAAVGAAVGVAWGADVDPAGLPDAGEAVGWVAGALWLDVAFAVGRVGVVPPGRAGVFPA